MLMRMYRYRNGNLRLKLLTGSEKWPPSLHLSKVPSLKLYSETFSEHESAKVSRITYSLTNFQVSSSFDTRLSIRSGPVGSGRVRSVQCMMTETGCWQGVRDNIIHSLSGLRAPIVLFILFFIYKYFLPTYKYFCSGQVTRTACGVTITTTR